MEIKVVWKRTKWVSLKKQSVFRRPSINPFYPTTQTRPSRWMIAPRLRCRRKPSRNGWWRSCPRTFRRRWRGWSQRRRCRRCCASMRSAIKRLARTARWRRWRSPIPRPKFSSESASRQAKKSAMKRGQVLRLRRCWHGGCRICRWICPPDGASVHVCDINLL